MQNVGGGVEEDAQSGFEESLVVAGLGVADHELVRFFADQQIDTHTTVAGGGDGFEQGFVRNEVGAAQNEPVLGVVHHGVEQAQVGFCAVSGSRWDELEDVFWCGGVGQAVGVAYKDFFALHVPVHGEHHFQGCDYRSGELHHHVNPVPAFFDVGGHEVGGVNEVL